MAQIKANGVCDTLAGRDPTLDHHAFITHAVSP